MALDAKRIGKPLRKLRKILRSMSKVPTQDQVHDVRTNARRIEATLAALQLDRKRKGIRVLGAVTPMRKKAGKVRDMDVLTGFAATLSGDGDDQCLVRLLERLGQERARTASKLRKTVVDNRKAARESLKACSTAIEKQFEKQSAKQQREWPADAAATALRLSGELADWPQLSARNLHPFRLKVKELRYVLQLSSEDSDLTERLGDVKDEIGEWHDWTHLFGIAKEVLSDCKHCSLVREVDKVAKGKFENALGTAQHVRRQFFEPGPQSQKTRRKAAMKEGVLEASAKLAA